jgi:hypothetical protein
MRAWHLVCNSSELLVRKLCHTGLICNYPVSLRRIAKCIYVLMVKMTRPFTKHLCIASLLSAASFTASFAASAADISSYGSLGTQGVGAGVSIPLTESSAVRLELNGLNFSKDFTEDSINYEGQLKNTSIAALYDWHLSPASPFRVTAGLIFNDGGMQAKGTSSATGSYTVGGTTVAAGAGERIDAKADFRKISPYLGIGWSKVAKSKGFSLFGDIGAFYANPKAHLSLTPALSAAVNAADPTALERETAKVQDRADNLKWYPVLRLGVRYTF